MAHHALDLVTNAETALAFGYMEGLLYAADPSRIMGEVARLKSLNNLLDSVGYEQHVYEGFVEETFGLLSEIANMSPNDQNNAALVARFTQDGVSESIITHFRVSVEDNHYACFDIL